MHAAGPGQSGAEAQELGPEHSTLQAHELLQSMRPWQDPRPSHSTAHAPSPQEMSPAQVFLASQSMMHELPLQEIGPAHESAPSHSISHGTSPHATLPGQLSSPRQFTTHAVASAGHWTWSQLW